MQAHEEFLGVPKNSYSRTRKTPMPWTPHVRANLGQGSQN